MSPRLTTVRTVKALRNRVRRWREAGAKIGLVPTMGYLHEGHLSLVRLALKKSDRVVVSIFVNPTQFAPGEDFQRYPRDEAGDRHALIGVGADLVFAPDAAEMYADDFATEISVGALSGPLCGVSRPQHFAGVATVVAKLLQQTTPDVAVFGEKDYQQLLIIKRMARDLDFPVKILGGATVRERDGLALSSRNAYLSSGERAVAPQLYRTLRAVAADIAKGRPVGDALQNGRTQLANAGFDVEYLEARDVVSLAPLETAAQRGRLFAAARLGRTRLIDNVAIAKRR